MIYGNKIIGTVAYMGGVMAVPQEFCWSWGQMIQYNSEYLCDPGQRIHYDRAKVSFHSYARNSLARRFYGDWLLMLDTDHSFEPDICARLLHLADKHEVDVISGAYQYVTPPYNLKAYLWDQDHFSPLGDWDRSVEILRVGGVGAGCLLVRRMVYDKIEEELRQNEELVDLAKFGREPFSIRNGSSEDLSFFLLCQGLGISAWLAPNVECYHLRTEEVHKEMMEPVPLSERVEVEGRI